MRRQYLAMLRALGYRLSVIGNKGDHDDEDDPLHGRAGPAWAAYPPYLAPARLIDGSMFVYDEAMAEAVFNYCRQRLVP